MAKQYHIDRDQLLKHNACEYWRERFDQDFPNGFVVNARNVRKALELGYPLSWTAYRLSDAHDCFNGEERESQDAMDLAATLGNIEPRDDNTYSRDAVRKAHDAMHKVATKWELFKIQHPDWLPANY